MEDVATLQHIIKEADKEIDRHHRDFAKIAEITHKALEDGWIMSPLSYVAALKEIRQIVG